MGERLHRAVWEADSFWTGVGGVILGAIIGGLLVGGWVKQLMEQDAVTRGGAEYTVDREGNVSWGWIEEESNGD